MNYKNYILYDSKRNTFFRGNLETTDNLITKIESVNTSLPPKGLIMPGFVNVHAHLGELPFRGGYFGKSLEQYLVGTATENKIHDYESARSEISQLTLGEMIEKGITTISGARVGEASTAWGIRSLSLYPLMKSEKLEHLLDVGAKDWDIEGYDGFFCHSLLMVDTDILKKIRATIKKNPGLYLQIHVAETELGAKQVEQNYGMSEVAVLNSLGLLNERTMLIHCTYCTNEDLELIIQSKATVVICPVSNHRLGSKILDVNRYIDRINFCISTDGPGTNDSLDILAELKFMSLLGGVEPKNLLPMITLNPARALGYEKEIGNLEVGKEADLVIFNTDTHFFPFRKLHNVIVLNPPTTNITKVMSRGKIIYQKDGKLTDSKRLKKVSHKMYGKYVKDNIN